MLNGGGGGIHYQIESLQLILGWAFSFLGKLNLQTNLLSAYMYHFYL